MAVSASATSAWLHTAAPSLQIFLENGSRTTAPGCQSSAAPGGRTGSTLSTSSARSCNHAGQIWIIRRPARCKPNGGSGFKSRCTSPISVPPKPRPLSAMVGLSPDHRWQAPRPPAHAFTHHLAAAGCCGGGGETDYEDWLRKQTTNRPSVRAGTRQNTPHTPPIPTNHRYNLVPQRHKICRVRLATPAAQLLRPRFAVLTGRCSRGTLKRLLRE